MLIKNTWKKVSKVNKFLNATNWPRHFLRDFPPRKTRVAAAGSLRSKRFQSGYCAKVRVEAKKKKKVEEGGGGEKRKRLPANPTILKNAP